MNFKEYMNMIEGRRVDEATMSLQDMLDNFRKVFPYSDKEAHVSNFHVDGKDKDTMKCTGIVISESDPSKRYQVTAMFHRDDIEQPFSIHNIGKVNCTCNAYRYNISHPNFKNTTQAEPIQGFSHIPNKVRNPKKESTVCKHLYSFLIFLYNKGLIKNN